MSTASGDMLGARSGEGGSAINETDETVYRRYLATGNESDLRMLLERYRESLILFSNGTVRNLDDAEEVMLDTFAAVAAGTARFGGQSSFRTWLFSIARRLAAKQMRKRKFLLEPLEDSADEGVPASDFGLLREERFRLLYQALEKIQPDYRQVLYLLYFEEMSNDEAARVMHKTPKQLYNLAYRGKQALKEALSKMGFSDAQY